MPVLVFDERTWEQLRALSPQLSLPLDEPSPSATAVTPKSSANSPMQPQWPVNSNLRAVPAAQAESA